MKNKPTFFVIILLCIVFIPMAFIGVNEKLSNKDSEVGGTGGQFYYRGTLNFYEKGKLLGAYSCSKDDSETCNYAKGTLNDLDSQIDAYKNGTKNNLGTFKVAGKVYTFIMDAEKVLLYSVQDNMTMLEFEAINFYNTDIENNLVIVKNEGKWGVLNLNTLKLVLDITYDYVGLINRTENNKLKSDILIVKKDNKYKLIKYENGEIKDLTTEYENLIYTYNPNKYLLTTFDGEYYKVYNFDGNSYLNNYFIKDIKITDKHIVIIDSLNNLNIFKNALNPPSYTEQLSEYETFNASEVDNKIEIYINEELYKSIDV